MKYEPVEMSTNDKGETYQKTYSIRKSGLRGTAMTCPAKFMAVNKLKTGDRVYMYIDEKNRLLISPKEIK